MVPPAAFGTITPVLLSRRLRAVLLLSATLWSATTALAQDAAPADDVQRLSAERDALAAELRDVQAAFDQAVKESTSRAAELARTARTTRADLAAMEARVSAAETAANQANRARDQAMAQVTAQRRALVALEREAAALRAAATPAGEGATENVAPLQDALEERERRLAEGQVEIERLENELASIRATAERELAALNEQVRQLRETNAALEERGGDFVAVAESATPAAEAVGRIAELEQRIVALAQENAELRARAEQAAAPAERELTGLRAQVVDLLAQLAAAASLHEDLRSEAVAAGVAAEQAREELAAVEAQLAAATGAGDGVAELQAQLVVARAEAAAAQRELALQLAWAAQRTTEEAYRPPAAALPAAPSVVFIPPSLPAPDGSIRRSPTRPGGTTTQLLSGAIERHHVVAPGDTLTRISARYYGTARRWNEVYEANRDTLSQANALRPGQRLRIP